jgi:PAS domain S-box-containing protein
MVNANSPVALSLINFVKDLLRAPRRLRELERRHAELTRSERRYRGLVEATSIVVWTAGPDGRSPDGTESWTAFTGRVPSAHAGLSWLAMVHPADREATRAAWLSAVANGTRYEAEYRMRRADGSYSPVRSRGIALLDEKGAVQEWVGFMEDLTAQREADARVAEAQGKLLAQERLAAVGELSAAVAHEVRNPLGAIFNALVVLRREVKHPLIEVVAEEGDRLNRIVRDLLDFARPVEPHLSGESMSKVIRQALQSVDVASRNIGVTLALSDEVDQLPMDGRLVRQLLINLFENAAQAMPGGGQLHVATQLRDQRLELVVADDGPGVPAHLRAKIFSPFFTTKATGTGLGLAVVKRIAESHGGSVQLDAAVARGCRFRVELPLVPRSASTFTSA